MSVAARLDDYQRRHPTAGFPLAVFYKHVDDQGGYLAALLAYYGLLSLFPLLLLLSTVLGIVLAGDPHAQQQVLHSALRDFPVIGSQLAAPKQLSGGAAALVVGILGALYGGLGVSLAVQNAANTAWRVPRNSRPNPVKARLRGLLLLVTGGGGLIITSLLSAIGGGAGPFGVLIRVLVLVVSGALNTLIFVLVMRESTSRPLTAHQVLPGGLLAAVIWQLLQSFGTTYVKHVVNGATATNGIFALFLGLIAFLYVASLAFMLCMQVNVVRVDRLYPRSLMTQFTDRVELTPGDRQAYGDQAKAQRSKGFQDVDVTFGAPPRD